MRSHDGLSMEADGRGARRGLNRISPSEQAQPRCNTSSTVIYCTIIVTSQPRGGAPEAAQKHETVTTVPLTQKYIIATLPGASSCVKVDEDSSSTIDQVREIITTSPSPSKS